MKSAITICLVPEAQQGPFVFHDGIDAGCRAAARAGFDAVEIFPSSAEEFPASELPSLLKNHSLGVAAVGTGAGWLKHRLSLTSRDCDKRAQAIQFISALIDTAGEYNAPAIIGSMQGQNTDTTKRAEALQHLAEGLGTLADRAQTHGQVLLYEPLNRYETNLLNTQEAAAHFLIDNNLVQRGVRLLCDLFHMNIEESSVPETIRRISTIHPGIIGHVHWADSNRRAMGFGRTNSQSIYKSLVNAGYKQYLAAEVFPLPSAVDAANQTIQSIRTCESS